MKQFRPHLIGHRLFEPREDSSRQLPYPRNHTSRRPFPVVESERAGFVGNYDELPYYALCLIYTQFLRRMTAWVFFGLNIAVCSVVAEACWVKKTSSPRAEIVPALRENLEKNGAEMNLH